MEKSDEEIFKKLPQTWKIIRNIWMKKEGSSPSAQSRVDYYDSEGAK